MIIEYITARTYEHWKRIGDVFEENGKNYVKVYEQCPKCGGTGIYLHFGTCFTCSGAGGRTKVVRAYTPDERAKLDAAAERRAERKEQDKIANAESVKEKEYEKYGFNLKENVTYVVAGENSYSYKDEIKNQGYKYDNVFGWHGSKPIELPENLILIKVDLNELAEINLYGKVFYNDGAYKRIKEIINNELSKDSTSDWLGEEGEYIDLDATVTKITGFSSYYGYTNVFTFESEGNIISWFTSTYPSLSEGNTVHIKAKIKKLDNYKGVRTTVITRPRFQ